ncbi:hypothetical protein B1160_09830 [Enterococcus faecium]|nr:hypothetical protein B1160_09830 [Enterococcus faecium]
MRQKCSLLLSHALFPNKRCSKACICGNKPNPTKNMSSYFFGLYLLLDAGQLFHNLIGFHFLFFS